MNYLQSRIKKSIALVVILTAVIVGLLAILMTSCARPNYSKPFVVEGIYYNEGACYYELSQVNKRGNKRYFHIAEEVGAKQLLDTVYLVTPGTLVYTDK